MNTISMKVEELRGAALDYAVACCEYVGKLPFAFLGEELHDPSVTVGSTRYSPSTKWEQGGPIILKANIAVEPDDASADWLARRPFATGGDEIFGGPTPLAAAMVSYVASIKGETIELPAVFAAGDKQ